MQAAAPKGLYAALAIAVVAILVLPLFVRNQYVFDVLSHAGIFILFACGLNIVVGLAGLLDLGYIAFAAIGAYCAAFLASPHFGIHLPFLAVIVVAGVTAAVFAVALGFPTLRLRGDYLSIVTLGFGEIVRIALLNGDWITGGSDGIQSIDRPNIFGYQFTFKLESYFVLIGLFCVLGIGIGEFLRRGRLGVIWQALRDDELAARSAGVNPLKYFLTAFAIGAVYAGVAGALWAMKQISISPDSFTVDQSILVLAIVVLGGLSGRFLPVAISALFVITMPEALRDFESYRMVIFGPILVLAIILRSRWDGGSLTGARKTPMWQRMRQLGRRRLQDQDAP
ncbi:branched-chain amino acid ABC transporter permease [Variovorax sp. SRS16]|uniref:branched-chain amino acid ABC transporter permease n=1 Tax=Variovorax sp. SRS16 TaxID=282217 RepID=UPI0013A5A7C6|nr:branched-chain amino acid ABC transporter permease [Variovorax sp. SRS16]